MRTKELMCNGYAHLSLSSLGKVPLLTTVRLFSYDWPGGQTEKVPYLNHLDPTQWRQVPGIMLACFSLPRIISSHEPLTEKPTAHSS